MKKILLLLSVLCIAIFGASCQTKSDGSTNATSQDSCVEQGSVSPDEITSGENDSSELDSEEGEREESTEDENSEWADIEFPRP